ncbi:hypothetical protein [Lentzea sp. NPDC092896]|uniref:hypothetical protein n=1 Tax=Lentzea sp. NPDC092896 TaxID=3364127 RepID=UPI0038070946
MSAHIVNWTKLIDLLEQACRSRQKSMRQVAKELGIAQSGLTRMQQGKSLSADATAALVAWLHPDDIPAWIEPNSERFTQPLQQNGVGSGR